ncbi:MAG: hypothetical protein JST84_28330 [Acidobacteria bacterium]|nr:hypothetical protein [Acidobacteriota bacterium]
MILSGTFPDRAAKMQVLARARDVCGEEKFVDQLKVNSQTAFPHPRWMSTVLSSLVLAQRIGSDGGIYLEGTKMSLRGSIETEEMKRRLITDATTNAGTAWIDDQIIVKHKAQAKKEGN